MLIGVIIAAAFLCIIFQVVSTYNVTLQNSPYFFWIFIITGIAVNLLWASLVKVVKDGDQILRLGSIWDVLMTVSWFVIPVLFFNVKLNMMAWVGILFLIIGVILLNTSRLI